MSDKELNCNENHSENLYDKADNRSKSSSNDESSFGPPNEVNITNSSSITQVSGF